MSTTAQPVAKAARNPGPAGSGCYGSVRSCSAAFISDMHIRTAILILSVGIARAQSGVPTFRAPSSGGRPMQLASGMLVSIYGADLGPQASCVGEARSEEHTSELQSL